MLSLLVQKSDEIQTETIKKFVLMKFRSPRHTTRKVTFKQHSLKAGISVGLKTFQQATCMFKKAYISMHSFDKTCVVVYVITKVPEQRQSFCMFLVFCFLINHTDIPIQLLESLLETDSTTKEADVNTFLAVLCDYSLATISGRGDNRVISIHSVTVWILGKKKTEDEKCDVMSLFL
jgi:hypothetical protein